MSYSTLIDLDELILQIRDKNSREYASDAVRAHRAGLNRAAVILIWTALAYDVEAKLRELAEQGDASAKTFVTGLDAAIASKNIQQLQKIESSLLDSALSPHEIIDDLDKVALERLKEDRNMCAHPAFTGDKLLFDPAPEQVRAHIVKAVLAVMKHAPVQGKAALDRLKQDLLQPSFPADQVQVSKFLAARYFKTLKKSLVGNLLTVLFKQMLLNTDSELATVTVNVARALAAASESFPLEYEITLKQIFTHQSATVDDEKLWRWIRLLSSDPRGWHWIDEATRMRVTQLLTNPIPNEKTSHVSDAFKIPELAEVLGAKYLKLEDKQLEVVIAKFPEPLFADAAVRIFGSSGSFRSAEERAATLIIPLAKHFTEAQMRQLFAYALENGQIHSAARIPEHFGNLRRLSESAHPTLAGDWDRFIDDAEKVSQSKAWRKSPL